MNFNTKFNIIESGTIHKRDALFATKDEAIQYCNQMNLTLNKTFKK